MSKGSGRRPTNEAAFASGWDRIFGNKKLLGSSSTVEQAVLSGTVEGSNPSSPAFQERIKAKVAVADSGCWEWQGAKFPNGLHSCDNPPCCNPAHLSVGDKSDNMQDMLARSRETRFPRGRPIPDDAIPILIGPYVHAEAAERLGVTHKQVRCWRKRLGVDRRMYAGGAWTRLVYVDDASGRIVDEDYWPNG